MTKRTDSQQSTMGHNASVVLENEAYVEAMKLLREQIHAQWLECPIRDKDGQQILLQLGKMTGMFEGILSGLVQKGKLAQARIDIKDMRPESAPRRFMRNMING